MRWLQFLQSPVTLTRLWRMPVTGNSEKLTRMSKLLDKLLKKELVLLLRTAVKFLQGKVLLSNELTVKNILGYKLLLIS